MSKLSDLEEYVDRIDRSFTESFNRLEAMFSDNISRLKNRIIMLNERIDGLDPKYLEAANTSSQFFKQMIENNLNNFEFFLKGMGSMSERIKKLEEKND